MSDSNNAFNESIIAEFRANGGVVGGPFEGASMVLLHTTGAKSGKPYVTPLVYRPDGDRIVIFASAAGAPKNPAWFHNIVANPDITVEVGTDKYEATATTLGSGERDPIWEAQKHDAPGFAEYEAKTSRIIPVVAVARKG